MTVEAKTATNKLSRLVHPPCTSTTSSRPITADAIRTEIIIASSVVGGYRRTTPKWGSMAGVFSPPSPTQDQIRQPSSAATEGSPLQYFSVGGDVHSWGLAERSGVSQATSVAARARASKSLFMGRA